MAAPVKKSGVPFGYHISASGATVKNAQSPAKPSPASAKKPPAKPSSKPPSKAAASSQSYTKLIGRLAAKSSRNKGYATNWLNTAAAHGVSAAGLRRVAKVLNTKVGPSWNASWLETGKPPTKNTAKEGVKWGYFNKKHPASQGQKPGANATKTGPPPTLIGPGPTKAPSAASSSKTVKRPVNAKGRRKTVTHRLKRKGTK